MSEYKRDYKFDFNVCPTNVTGDFRHSEDPDIILGGQLYREDDDGSWMDIVDFTWDSKDGSIELYPANDIVEHSIHDNAGCVADRIKTGGRFKAIKELLDQQCPLFLRDELAVWVHDPKIELNTDGFDAVGTVNVSNRNGLQTQLEFSMKGDDIVLLHFENDVDKHINDDPYIMSDPKYLPQFVSSSIGKIKDAVKASVAYERTNKQVEQMKARHNRQAGEQKKEVKKDINEVPFT